MPSRREAHVLSLMTIAAAIILCGISIYRGFHGQTFMGRPLGGDVIEVYVIGKILNSFAAARIYDLELAVGLQHSILPSMAPTQMLVYAHAPYVALLFKPFAMLPYSWAYIAWLVFSALLYIAGVHVLFRVVDLQANYRITGFLLAVAFMPFIFETWIGGQLSVVVFFVWALFFYCLRNGQKVLAGTVLSLALFKPTLIALPVVMLIFGRRWRVLSGFAAGSVSMALLSLQSVGIGGCRAWIKTLVFVGKNASGGGEAWHLAKSVDLLSFFHLLFFNASPLSEMVVAVCSIAGVVTLAKAWRRLSMPGVHGENVLWAATLCFTLVVNSYAPIYDTILVVIATALAFSALKEQHAEDRAMFAAWLLALYMTPWFTQSSAEFLHFQLFTLVLGGFGAWTLRWAYRSGQEADLEAILVVDENLKSDCYTTGQ